VAQAAFFINGLKISDHGGHLVLEGTHTCQGGHVIDTVFIKVPAKLKPLFTQTASPGDETAPPPAKPPAGPTAKPPDASPGHNRVRRYLEGN
jgi:hypothetical protein